ncbi:unnamed protein product [Protopolystoma xenopodis]|uniref:Uncharacterized protein n=1 Tax=Protopolystoma xenopodis TaxID=117903 RepID=A0A448X5A4_9PLAT|nr:unnamed protein product [Protopolystoma xenopodis]
MLFPYSTGDSSNVLISSDATPVKTPSNPCRLDGLVNQLVRDARSSQIPVFFSLTRRELRYLCHKPALVSAVGVINWDGAEELGSRLAKLYREPSPPSFAESFHHPTTTSTQRLRP